MRHSLSFFRAIITSLSEGVERSTALNGVMGSIRETPYWRRLSNEALVSKPAESLIIFFQLEHSENCRGINYGYYERYRKLSN